jgi:hypothetical protein
MTYAGVIEQCARIVRVKGMNRYQELTNVTRSGDMTIIRNRCDQGQDASLTMYVHR